MASPTKPIKWEQLPDEHDWGYVSGVVGDAKAEAVLEELRKAGHPLTKAELYKRLRKHSVFSQRLEEDDSVAAERYRRLQFANLLRTIKEHLYTDPDDSRTFEVFRSVQVREPHKSPEWVVWPTWYLMKTEQWRTQLLNRAKHLSNVYASRYEAYTEYAVLHTGKPTVGKIVPINKNKKPKK